MEWDGMKHVAMVFFQFLSPTTLKLKTGIQDKRDIHLTTMTTPYLQKPIGEILEARKNPGLKAWLVQRSLMKMMWGGKCFYSHFAFRLELYIKNSLRDWEQEKQCIWCVLQACRLDLEFTSRHGKIQKLYSGTEIGIPDVTKKGSDFLSSDSLESQNGIPCWV